MVVVVLCVFLLVLVVFDCWLPQDVVIYDSFTRRRVQRSALAAELTGLVGDVGSRYDLTWMGQHDCAEVLLLCSLAIRVTCYSG